MPHGNTIIMESVDPIYRNLIQFVPQQEDSSVEIKVAEKKRDTQFSSASGTDVKNFYESVVGSNDNPVKVALQQTSSKRKKTGKVKSKKNHIDPKISDLKNVHVATSSRNSISCTSSALRSSVPTHFERKQFKFLQAAQMGHVSEVKDLLHQGIDINHRDFYGWTALMCAAKEGHGKVVVYLLKQGADIALKNNDNQTADSLSQLAGHSSVTDILLSSRSQEMAGAELEEQPPLYHCPICKGNFPEGERSHQTSTVHLFNSGRKVHKPSYLLPESNRGFQMLLRSGWQVDQGLGPEGQGVKYPVKTVLKRDREGLGHGSDFKKKAKITHFDPLDKAAVEKAVSLSLPGRQVSARKSAQYAAKSKERKQRNIEKNFRREFSDI